MCEVYVFILCACKSLKTSILCVYVWDVCVYVCVLCACMSLKTCIFWVYVWRCIYVYYVHAWAWRYVFYVCMCGVYVCVLCACLNLKTYSMCVCVGCMYVCCVHAWAWRHILCMYVWAVYMLCACLSLKIWDFGSSGTRVAGSCGLLASAGNWILVPSDNIMYSSPLSHLSRPFLGLKQ